MGVPSENNGGKLKKSVLGSILMLFLLIALPSLPCHASPAPYITSAFIVNAATGITQTSFLGGESLEVGCLLETIAFNISLSWTVTVREPDQTVYSIASSNAYCNPSNGASYTETSINESGYTITEGTYTFNIIPFVYTEMIPNDAQVGVWNVEITISTFVDVILTFYVT